MREKEKLGKMMKTGRVLWIAPIILAFVYYYACIHNFFLFDDFIWLLRSTNLINNPSQLILPDGYFDPLIHLVFALNYLVFKLDYRAYHLIDIAIHSINGVMLYYYALMHTEDRAFSAICASVFVTSFALVDAVVWPSSRVDLFLVMFSLLTLLTYAKYSHTGRAIYITLSYICFFMALCSKGTALVIPLIIVVICKTENKRLKATIAPYFGMAVLYSILLYISLPPPTATGVKFNFLKPNFYNYALSLSELIVPEYYLSREKVVLVFIGIVLGVSASLFINIDKKFSNLRIIGISICLLSLLPVMPLSDFSLVKTLDTSINLLGSPSHRIYLSATGFSLFACSTVAGIFAKYYGFNNKVKLLLSLFLVVFLVLSYNCVNYRISLWRDTSKMQEAFLNGISKYKEDISDKGYAIIVNPIGAGGFIEPMFKVYFGVNNVDVYPLKKIDTSNAHMFDAPFLLDRIDKSAFFVAGGSGLNAIEVYNLTDEYRKLVSMLISYHNMTNPDDRRNKLAEYAAMLHFFDERVEACKGTIFCR